MYQTLDTPINLMSLIINHDRDKMETAGYPLKLKNADNLNTMFIVTSSSPSLRVHIIVRFLNTKSDEIIYKKVNMFYLSFQATR